MFLDDDVALEPNCVSTLIRELRRRPAYGALGADYLRQFQSSRIAPHVSMGATVFRREALDQIFFAWRENRCECQICCDDLRRLGWGIDYFSPANARHLPVGEVRKNVSATATPCGGKQNSDSASRRKSDTVTLPSVCLVACYFGPPPGWIKYYLKSCGCNPSIDFLIFTDQSDFPDVPPNVRVMRISGASFASLATKTIGTPVRINYPHKLCDFKPIYGHMFEKFLKGWDYWGYTDLDVVYGDIRKFLSVAKLQQYDVFTARKEFLVGHFTLFRNNRHMRSLYQKGFNYRATLQSPTMQSFSECGKQWRRRLQGRPLGNNAACDSMTHIVYREMAKGNISASFSPVVIERPELASIPNWRLRWQAGRLWSVDYRREAMYFHFNAFSRRSGFREPSELGTAPSFEITPNGFESPHKSHVRN
jgi:hypothetical protein